MVLFKAPRNSNKVLLQKKYFLLLGVVFSSAITSQTLAAGAGNSCANIFSSSQAKLGTLNASPEPVKQGFLGKLKSVFGKSYDVPETKQQIHTKVRLSGHQLEQENSVQDNLKQVQQVIDYANDKLLTEFTAPEQLYVSFDEKENLNSAGIRAYELNLGKKEEGYFGLSYLKSFLHGSAQKEAVPVIAHEYFHLILNRAIADISPVFAEKMKESLQESHSERIEHKEDELEQRVSDLKQQADITRSLINNLNDLKSMGPGSFTRPRVKLLKKWLEMINREDLFADIEFTEQNVDEMIQLFEKFRNDSLTRAHKAETRHANMESAKLGEGKLDPTHVEGDPIQMAQINSFYSGAIHELFADLGAILLTGDPSALGKQLNSVYRDFSHDWTFDEALQEYTKSKEQLMALAMKRARDKAMGLPEPTPEQIFEMYGQIRNLHAIHPFFYYQRSLLWKEYFSKAPKKKWPKMLKDLADAFAKEIVTNPTGIYDVLQTDNTSWINFERANRHLETVIRTVLERP